MAEHALELDDTDDCECVHWQEYLNTDPAYPAWLAMTNHTTKETDDEIRSESIQRL